MENPTLDRTEVKEKRGCKRGCLCFVFCVIVTIVFILIIPMGGNVSTSNDYNDNSTTHQILAKNYFKDYLKDNLKDAKSYEEVYYTSDYNSHKGCYEVTLKYRATNSFGAKVLGVASADVYFSNDVCSIKNVRIE